MASDNGDLEVQEDALDAAIKSHRRIASPDCLIDRCLATLPGELSQRETNSATPAASTQVQGRRVFFPWVKLAVAASLLIGAAMFLAPRIQEARESASRAVGRNNLKQVGLAMENFHDATKSGDDASRPNSIASRMPKHVRDGTSHTFGMGAVASTELSSQGEVDYVAGNKYPDPKTWEDLTARGGGEQKAVSQQTPAEADSIERRLGKGTMVAGRGLPGGDLKAKGHGNSLRDQLEETQKALSEGDYDGDPGAIKFGERQKVGAVAGAKENQVLEQQVKSWRESITAEAENHRSERVAYDKEIKDQQKNYAELSEAYKKARADAAKYAEEAKLYGDDAKIRAEVEARLRASERALQTRQEQLESFRLVGPNAESYSLITDNPFLPVSKCPLSTFSTDVDTASYANVRRFLSQGQMPPRDAVRIEELINYFSYDYPQPKSGDPFSVNLEVAGCPWNGDHRLVRIGLKGREIADQQRPPANLVFLVDVSGSMQPANKLPLLKTAMKMLVGWLGENERVAIVTYSHEIRLVLPSTTCDSKETIIQALEGLQAAGSTNGGGGIQMAYSVAVENFIPGGTNRVILATDGDFNVGITDPGELTRYIEQKRESGVFLSVLGFGMGNLKDATLERLADKGNGHYAYIDNSDEARKVLVDQLSGTLVTIAKDVKLQIEFNPRTVSAYRLIGYENRVMPAQDFNDDRKDAGDIGAGHTVTALYEIVPAGKSAGLPGTDPLKYQPDEKPAEELRPALDDGLRGDIRRELLTVKLRYKKPNEHQSLLAEIPLTDSGRRYGEASSDFKFASAVAAFGMILRGSPHRGSATLDGVLELGEDGRGADREGYRAEFINLAKRAKTIRGQ